MSTLILLQALRKQKKLADRRHPMFDKNRFGKYLIYGMGIFWAVYLVLIGILFAHIIADASPSMEAYHVMDKYLLIILGLDFLLRFGIQKIPALEVKPYLLLPVKRQRIVDLLLLRPLENGPEFLWMCFFVPFAFSSNIFQFYGLWGVITYCLGLILLLFTNNYLYILCRTLIQERLWWVFLPTSIYAGLYAWLFLGGDSLKDFFMNLGEGYIEGNIVALGGTLAAVVIVWLICRQVIGKIIYVEVSKQEDTRVKRVREFGFLDRYGEIGEYMRLELKMLLRNKKPKISMRMLAIMVIIFSALLSFTPVYDSKFMLNFIGIYNMVVFGMVMLSQLMSYEGNYIDGLMSRKESILNLLKAKYYLSCLFPLIPFILTLPTVFTGKLDFMQLLSYLFFAIGCIHFLLFQGAVYCNKTVPLNENLTGKQPSSAFQYVLSFSAFGLPLIIIFILEGLVGPDIAYAALTIVGVGFVLTSNWWIANIYHRFMARRYQNMEGFRDTN